MGKLDSRVWVGLGFTILAATLFRSTHLTLFSGQVIKQFETFSLMESLSQVGWNPLETKIPCDGGLRWVLEPPIYILLGALFHLLSPEVPALFPISVFVLFAAAGWAILRELFPSDRSDPTSRGLSLGFAVLLFLSAPVFLRFSTQYLPDPFAVAVMLWGCVFGLRGRAKLSHILFALAVTIKPTVLFSVFFFRWAFLDQERFVRSFFFSVIYAIPFLGWSVFLKWTHVLSPLHQGGLLRVFDGWEVLLERGYYSKFWVWTVFKGVGLPLFLMMIGGIYWGKMFRTPVGRSLLLWAIGIFPYWIIVRRLNVTHDYYSLSFFIPWAISGIYAAHLLLKSASEQRLRMGIFALLFLSWTLGYGSFLRSSIAHPRNVRVEDRPQFCGPEFRSKELMPNLKENATR